jgi:hypothetical protein
MRISEKRFSESPEEILRRDFQNLPRKFSEEIFRISRGNPEKRF